MFAISRGGVTLFGFELRFYGILIALGVLGAVLLASRRERRLGLKPDTALNLALLCVPVAIVCARAYYVLFSWDYYSVHPEDILNIREGGLAIYGGVIGGILTGWVYCRCTHMRFAAGLDLVAPSLALGQAIGRWGNFLNQEAYGRAVTNPRLQFFPLAVRIEGSGWHWATFFYESLWCALIVVFLLRAEKEGFFRRRGDVFGWYLFLYALERALVEGLRTDSLYWGPLRVSQALSLAAMFALSLALAHRTWALSRSDGKASEENRTGSRGTVEIARSDGEASEESGVRARGMVEIVRSDRETSEESGVRARGTVEIARSDGEASEESGARAGMDGSRSRTLALCASPVAGHALLGVALAMDLGWAAALISLALLILMFKIYALEPRTNEE